MSFEKGTLNICFLRSATALPNNNLELFQGKVAGKLDDVSDKAQIGWVSGRHLLERKIDETTSLIAGFPYLNLRISQRKIPSALLRAECRKGELDYMLAKDITFVPAKVKASIKREIEEARLMSMPPTISGIPLVLSPKDAMIYVSTSSLSRLTILQELFEQTLKVGTVHLDFANSANLLLGEKIEKYQAINFRTESTNSTNELSSRDFLTWLWFHSETEEGEVKLRKNSYNCLVDGPLSFASSEECEGSFEISIRKGMPSRSAEAKSALAVGKKLKKASITLAKGKDIWKAVFNADSFIFTSLALPEGEKLDPASAFDERLRLIAEFHAVITEYIRTFFIELKSQDWKNKQRQILKWAEERVAY
jgi:hypothetical protein